MQIDINLWTVQAHLLAHRISDNLSFKTFQISKFCLIDGNVKTIEGVSGLSEFCFFLYVFSYFHFLNRFEGHNRLGNYIETVF